MKLFDQFRRRDGGAAAPDPQSPHVFLPMNDAGMGAAAAGSGGGMTGQPLGMNIAVTGNFQRELHCGVPGCGRDRNDPMHWPEG